jgi:hypothetical protein
VLDYVPIAMEVFAHQDCWTSQGGKQSPTPPPPPLPPPPSDKYLLTQRLHLKQGPAQAATSLPCPSPSPPSAASATVPCCTVP